MLSKYIPKRYANALLKHVVAVTLFIPYMYCKDLNFYYQEFILANFFAILTMITIFTSWKLDLRKNGILLAGMGILLIAYNVVATYMNYNYHHWYGEQINTTISFLFFMVLLMVKDSHALFDSSLIRSIIHMMVTTNVLAIGYRLITGQNRILFLNNYVRLDKYTDGMAPQYSWLYVHKSQYALILVLCIAFCLVYRKMFRNIVTYLMSLGVLLFALYLSDCYTSILSTILIFSGKFIDYILKTKSHIKITLIIIGSICAPAALIILYNFISAGRDIFTLNDRTLIWKSAINNIIQNPNGISDYIMGANTFLYNINDDGLLQFTYNCHNIVLNHIFRFSLPVGGIYGAFWCLIFLFIIKLNLSFLTISVITAILISILMDYSILCSETSVLLTFLFCIYFQNNKPKN